MADNYKPAGYQNSLLFDPSRGVIKYGNYEFFADQVGVKPQTQTLSFKDYAAEMSSPSARLYGQQKTEAQLRADFAKDVQSGAYSGPKPVENVIGVNKSPIVQNTTTAPQFRNVHQQDADTYSVTSYDIPKDVEFVNRLNADAANLAANAAQGQVTDSSRPNPNNARLGKPNYSRAATILAGEQAPLGGAATTLGA